MFKEANSGDLLYTRITFFTSLLISPPHFCLLSFLSYELSLFFALPPFTPDKLLCKFVECTQARDLDEVSLFSLLKGARPAFFFSFGYERGKKGPSWQSDKESFRKRDTKRWGKKRRKILRQYLTVIHLQFTPPRRDMDLVTQSRGKQVWVFTKIMCFVCEYMCVRQR